MFFSTLAGLLLLVFQVVSLQLNDKIVDDSYDLHSTRLDGIQYSPYWLNNVPPSGSAPRYNNTLHWTTTPQANLIYFFQGNAIYYYGDKDTSSAPIVIRLDNGTEETADATASSTHTQQLLWSKTGLGPGDHQLVIKHNGTSNQYLWLDYLRIESDHGFIPSISGPAASSVPTEALLIDDRDASLVYSSNWTTDPAKDYPPHYGHTLHFSDTPGDYVSLKFSGTAVWYFSNTNRQRGNVQVQIDGGKTETVSMYGQTWLQQQLMWSKTDLSDGDHTVTFTHADADGIRMTLDFLRYLPSQSTSNKQTPLGVIIGGTVGGVAVLLLCALVIFYLRRRRSPRSGTLNSIDLLGQVGYDHGTLPVHAQTANRYSQQEWDYRGHPYPSQNMHHVSGFNRTSREKTRLDQTYTAVRSPADSDSSLLSTTVDSDSVRSVAVGSAMVSERTQILPPAYPQTLSR